VANGSETPTNFAENETAFMAVGSFACMVAFIASPSLNRALEPLMETSSDLVANPDSITIKVANEAKEKPMINAAIDGESLKSYFIMSEEVFLDLWDITR
jgi:hypothetical protein